MPQTSCKDPTARQANGARSPTAGGLDPHLVEQIQAIAERHPGPFYVYDRATLRTRRAPATARAPRSSSVSMVTSTTAAATW
jgi:hypothetical protein